MKNEQDAPCPDPGRPQAMAADPKTSVEVVVVVVIMMRMKHKPCRVSTGVAESLDKVQGLKVRPGTPFCPTPFPVPQKYQPSHTRHHAHPYVSLPNPVSPTPVLCEPRFSQG